MVNAIQQRHLDQDPQNQTQSYSYAIKKALLHQVDNLKAILAYFGKESRLNNAKSIGY